MNVAELIRAKAVGVFLFVVDTRTLWRLYIGIQLDILRRIVLHFIRIQATNLYVWARQRFVTVLQFAFIRKEEFLVLFWIDSTLHESLDITGSYIIFTQIKPLLRLLNNNIGVILIMHSIKALAATLIVDIPFFARIHI